MSSANGFNLDQSKIWSFGNGLSNMRPNPSPPFMIPSKSSFDYKSLKNPLCIEDDLIIRYTGPLFYRQLKRSRNLWLRSDCMVCVG